MKSMTGYGKGFASASGREVTVELKSVNNRYLEVNSRLPKALSMCEESLRKAIGQYIKRGAVDVYFTYENKNEDEKVVTADFGLISEYVSVAKQIEQRFGIKNDITAGSAMKFPEAIKVEVNKDKPEIIAEIIYKATLEAAKALDDMRAVEGKTIFADLSDIVKKIKTHLAAVVQRVPVMMDEYREKLKARISEYLKEVELDEARLVNEVAFFADKADINEEIQRLNSHITQFEACCESGEPVGRKLDFISQEMNREMNTMGSKSNDVTITNAVVAMKNELEKIKEQIRNVE